MNGFNPKIINKVIKILSKTGHFFKSLVVMLFFWIMIFLSNSIEMKCPEINRRYVNLDQNGEFIFKNCMFIKIDEILCPKGGAILMNGITALLSVHQCSFFNCSSTEKGGAIYFLGKEKSSFKLKESCALNCRSQTGMFCYCLYFNDFSIEDTTLASFRNNDMVISIGLSGLLNAILSSVNYSNSVLRKFGFLYLDYCSNVSISYNSLVGNIVSEMNLIKATNQNEIFCEGNNFINNHLGTENDVIISTEPFNYMRFRKCVFYGNQNNHTYLFEGLKVILHDCFISHEYSLILKKGNVYFNDCSLNQTQFSQIPLTLFSSYECKSETTTSNNKLSFFVKTLPYSISITILLTTIVILALVPKKNEPNIIEPLISNTLMVENK